ncbi:tetratricopeptide repeat protein [Crocinitomicaceae bacterium]|nr:tetratricopeptide repeat protein [Crocinitomicaceae bacterium]
MKELVYIMLIFFIGHAFSQTRFDEGVQLLHEKKWEKALSIFEELSDSSSSVAVDYNMGLCYTGQEDLNSAIYFFERALKEDPSNNIIIENATLAHSKIYPDEYWTHPYAGIERLTLSISVTGWLILSVVFSLLLAWIIFSGILHADKRLGWRLALTIPLWVFILYGSYRAISHQSSEHFCFPKQDIVTTYLSKGGLASEEKLLPGKRHRIDITSDEEWLCIEGPLKQLLWVKREDVYVY